MCSASCAAGTHSRTRFVAVSSMHGGAACGASTDTAACNLGPCPVHCAVTAFSPFSPCTATCGGCAFYHTELCPGKVDCGGYTRAFNCLRDHHCGYCEDDSTCRDGDRDGPNAGVCSAWHTLSSYSSNATRARARAGSRVRRGERLLDELGVLMPLQQEQQAHQRFSEIGAQADPRYRAS